MSEKKERIVLDVAYQPQVRTNTDTRRIMLDVIIALIPAVIVAVIQFGAAPLVVIASSVASCVFFEWGYRKLMKKDNSIGDLSAAVTGLLPCPAGGLGQGAFLPRRPAAGPGSPGS